MKKTIPAKWKTIWDVNPSFTRARLMAMYPNVEWPPHTPIWDVFEFGGSGGPAGSSREIDLDIPYSREVSGHVYWTRTDFGSEQITITAEDVEECVYIDHRGNRGVDRDAVRRLINRMAEELDYDNDSPGDEEIDWDSSEAGQYGEVDTDTAEACGTLREWIEEHIDEFFPDVDDGEF